MDILPAICKTLDTSRGVLKYRVLTHGQANYGWRRVTRGQTFVILGVHGVESLDLEQYLQLIESAVDTARKERCSAVVAGVRMRSCHTMFEQALRTYGAQSVVACNELNQPVKHQPKIRSFFLIPVSAAAA